MDGEPMLVGDIGGTNVRLAIWDPHRPSHLQSPWSAPCADYPGVLEAIDAYLGQMEGARPARVSLAVAGPVGDGRVALTNNRWIIDRDQLIAGGFVQVRLLNDFAALAWATPTFTQSDRIAIGPSLPPIAGAPVAVVGPGTGLGAAVVQPLGPDWVVLATEAGHVDFAPNDDLEIEILRILRRDLGRAAVESLLSGSGLTRLHRALALIEGRSPDILDERQIVGLAGSDAACGRTVARFWMILASVAGDLALTLGARGGVYLAGGVTEKILPFLDTETFRKRFENKGAMAPHNERINTWAISAPFAALRGAGLSAAR